MRSQNSRNQGFSFSIFAWWWKDPEGPKTYLRIRNTADMYQKCSMIFRILMLLLRVHWFIKYGPCCSMVIVVVHWIPIEIPAFFWIRTRDQFKGFKDQKQEISVLKRIGLDWHILAGSGSASRARQSGSGSQTGSFWHINLYNFP